MLAMKPSSTKPRPRHSRGLFRFECALFAPSLFGLSTGFQSLRPISVSRWKCEKISCIHRERGGDPFKQIDGRIKTLTLNFANCRAINTRINRKMLLRDRLFRSDSSDIPSDARPQIHEARGTTLPGIYPSDISNIIGLAASATLNWTLGEVNEFLF